MANEIDLNDLTIKTDSLPDAWKVLLIDPETGLPARNMTVARFVELLMSKLPETVKYNDMASIDFTTEVGYGYSTQGWFSTGPILKFGTSDGYQVHIQGNPYENKLFMRGIYNESYKPWKTFAFLEDMPNLTAVSCNTLTDTISDNYSFTPPPQIACQTPRNQSVQSSNLRSQPYRIQTPLLVQLQLEVNHRNSMSGQSTRSEKLSWNYRQKTRDLNKSSISLTIARYNKCNLPRAGPPRLIN